MPIIAGPRAAGAAWLVPPSEPEATTWRGPETWPQALTKEGVEPGSRTSGFVCSAPWWHSHALCPTADTWGWVCVDPCWIPPAAALLRICLCLLSLSVSP